jgi:hypothetical protein
MVKKTGKKIKIVVGGRETEAELAVDTCFAITKKRDGRIEHIVVAPVVAKNAKGKEVVRFKRVADESQCPGTPKVLNRHAPKLKIGYKEAPKALGVLTGARKAAPAKVWGKLVVAAAKKKSRIIGAAKTATTTTTETKPAA